MTKSLTTGAAALAILVFVLGQIAHSQTSGASSAAATAAQKTVWDRVFSEEQAKRGEALYQKRCALCHRNDLTGTTSDGPPLKGLDFFIRWRGMTLTEMIDSVKEIMPANNPGSLEPQGYLDVIGFLFKSNGVPTGETDLPADSNVLQQILITETAPKG
jgi:cytochrome c